MEYFDVGTSTDLPQSDQKKYKQSIMWWEQALIYLTLTKERIDGVLLFRHKQ